MPGGGLVGRGLSVQQQRVLALAYSNALRRAEREAEEQARVRHLNALLAATTASRGKESPTVLAPYPLPDLTHSAVLLALYGWRSGKMQRSWLERRGRIQTDTVRVYASFGPYDEAGTISRSEYEVAHASVSRTTTRLIQRGLLEDRGRGAYYLTDAGRALCAELHEATEAGAGDG